VGSLTARSTSAVTGAATYALDAIAEMRRK